MNARRTMSEMQDMLLHPGFKGRPMNKTKFRRGTNVLVRCRCCGKMTHSSIDGCIDIRLCRVCFESAEQMNAHSDGAHATMQDCARNNCPVGANVQCLHEVKEG